MACECLKRVDAELVSVNSGLRASMTGKVVLATRKLEPQKRQPARTMLATFCPFCGRRYD